MTYTFRYITCNRCHGTRYAIKGAHTTSRGAEPVWAECWDCDNGYQVTITKQGRAGESVIVLNRRLRHVGCPFNN